MSELLKIDVSEHTEKKNGLTYLSWAWAWSEVLKIDPMATWEAVEFDGFPASFAPDGSAMVKTIVTIKGHAKSCWLPVMDYKNKAIKGPDAFAINTAMVRCLTKCISMHGLGLYIYAGEDLPESDDKPEPKPELRHRPVDGAIVSQERMTVIAGVADAINEQMARDDILGAYEEAIGVTDAEEKTALWAMLDSKTRSAIKKVSEQLKEKA